MNTLFTNYVQQFTWMLPSIKGGEWDDDDDDDDDDDLQSVDLYMYISMLPHVDCTNRNGDPYKCRRRTDR